MEPETMNMEKFASVKIIPEDLELLGMKKLSSSSRSSRSLWRKKRQLSNLSVSTTKEDTSDGVSTPGYDLKEFYETVKPLGVGTYGLVNLATEKATGKRVAIKTSRGNTSREFLKNEYELLKKLQHENIITPDNLYEDLSKKESYLVMEYFEGKNLNEFIEDNGTFNLNDAKIIFKQLLSALQTLHELGIAHRDIKPENILVDENLRIKLIDFNISKLHSSRSKPGEESKFHSVFYTQISSPLYSAPELKGSYGYTESIDVWGLGIVLFSMLCGTFQNLDLPDDKEERLNSLNSIINSEVKEEDCIELLLSLLSKCPQSRPTVTECSSANWLRGDK